MVLNEYIKYLENEDKIIKKVLFSGRRKYGFSLIYDQNFKVQYVQPTFVISGWPFYTYIS